MPTVLITGGTGLIGSALTKELLKRKYEVIILTRSPREGQSKSAGLSYAGWDIDEGYIDKAAIEKADHVVHLAGANVADRRWTDKRKKEILESRTKTAELLVKAIRETSNKIKCVVSISGIGWYGPDHRDHKPFIETDPPYDDFLGQTCLQWEASVDPVSAMGKRLVKFRTGIVLSKDGGALYEFTKYLKFGLATILGSGRQAVSWIHIDDVVRLFVTAIENETFNGVYNAVAPYPVTNKTFVLELARQTRGKFFIPVYVPTFMLKLILGEMSIEVIKSATVSSGKIKQTGFSFLHPTIQSAIRQLSGD